MCYRGVEAAEQLLWVAGNIKEAWKDCGTDGRAGKNYNWKCRELVNIHQKKAPACGRGREG